jgi:hypothetical protein
MGDLAGFPECRTKLGSLAAPRQLGDHRLGDATLDREPAGERLSAAKRDDGILQRRDTGVSEGRGRGTEAAGHCQLNGVEVSFRSPLG